MFLHDNLGAFSYVSNKNYSVRLTILLQSHIFPDSNRRKKSNENPRILVAYIGFIFICTIFSRVNHFFLKST